MAIDNTPPRLKLIVTIAIITIVTLVSLDFVFKSYYAIMTDEAQREKVAPTRDKEDQIKAEQASLTQAAMPLDQAAQAFAKGTRPDAIKAQASDDLGAVTGWSKMPKPTPHPEHPVPASPAAVTPGSGETDGGATATGDGGASPLATDGGAPHMAADGGKPAGDAGAHHAPGH